MSKRFDESMTVWKEQIDKRLAQIVERESGYPREFAEVLSYSLFPGGKRLRPILCLAWHELFADVDEYALDYACGIELLHSYSLIHDDMPCMDNDEYRRDKLTVHKKYGEGVALLAGDALMDLAYRYLNKPSPRCAVPPLATEHCEMLFGGNGLISGQYYDLYGEITSLDQLIKNVHEQKTAALIKFACISGAMLGVNIMTAADGELIYSTGDDCSPIIRRDDKYLDAQCYAADFGLAFGIAFQLYDDISEYIAGENLSKTSVLNFVDLEYAKRMLNKYLNDAVNELRVYGRTENTEFLRELTEKFIIA